MFELINSKLAKKAPAPQSSSSSASVSSKLRPPTSVKYTAPTPPPSTTATTAAATNPTVSKAPMQTGSTKLGATNLATKPTSATVPALSSTSASNASHAVSSSSSSSTKGSSSTSSSSSLLIGSTKLKYSANPAPSVNHHHHLKIVAAKQEITAPPPPSIANNVDYRSLLKSTANSNSCYARASTTTIDEQPSLNEFMMSSQAKVVNDLVINTTDHQHHQANVNGIGQQGGLTTSGIFSGSSSSSSSSSSAGTGSSSSSSSLILSSPTTSPSRNSIQIHHLQMQEPPQSQQQQQQLKQTNIQIPLQIKRQASANLNINIVNTNPPAQKQQQPSSSSLLSSQPAASTTTTTGSSSQRYSMSSIPSFARSSFHANPKLTTATAKPPGVGVNNPNVSKIMITEDHHSASNTAPNAQDGVVRRYSSLHITKSSLHPSKPQAEPSDKLNQINKLLSGAKSAPSTAANNKLQQLKNDELDQMNRTFSIEDYNDVLAQGEMMDDGLLLSDYEQKPSAAAAKSQPVAAVNTTNIVSVSTPDATSSSTTSSDLFAINHKLDQEILLFESKFDLMSKRSSRSSVVNTNDTGATDKTATTAPVVASATKTTDQQQQQPAAAPLSHIRISRNVSLSDEFLENESLPDDLLVEEMQNFIDSNNPATATVNTSTTSKDDLQLLSNNFLDQLQFTPSAVPGVPALSALASSNPDAADTQQFFSLPIQIEPRCQTDEPADQHTSHISLIAETPAPEQQVVFVVDDEVQTVLTDLVDQVAAEEEKPNETAIEEPAGIDAVREELPEEIKEQENISNSDAIKSSSAESLASDHQHHQEQPISEMNKKAPALVDQTKLKSSSSAKTTTTTSSSSSLASQILSRRLPLTSTTTTTPTATQSSKPTATGSIRKPSDVKPAQQASSSSSLSRTSSVKEPQTGLLATSSSGSALASGSVVVVEPKKTVITINSAGSSSVVASNREAHRSPTPPSSSATTKQQQIIRKVPSTIKSSSSSSTSAQKQPKSQSSTAEQVQLHQDDDVNSVFDADRQSNTSLNSDNEESKLSVKSLSRAIESSKAASSSASKLTKSKRPAGAAIPAPTKPVAATIAHISVVNSSNNSNPALNKTASNDTIASSASATATSTPAQTSLRIKGLRTITNNSAVKKSHNKENQVQLPHQHHELPKSIAMNKIYKSRDGLAAVSSNTSIMSELSNISKSSLPTSTLIRQASISSSTSSVKNNQPNSQTPSVGTKNSSHNPTSLLIRQQTFGGDLKQSMTANRLGSTSSVKQQQQNAAPIQARNSVVAAIASLQLHADPLRKASVHGELAKSSSSSNGGLRRPPGVTNSHPSSSSVSNAAVHETAAALQVITKVAAAVSNSSQSPSKAAAASSSAKPLSTEAKLGNEIKRLEALCESRTKELTMLKMRLRDTIFSFDGIVVAYNYLANHLNGFEASSLRVRLETTMRKNEELVRSLKSEIGEKDRALKQTQTNLANLTTEMNDMRAKLESQLAKQAEEYEIRRQLTVQEHELIVRDLKQERERDVKRLNKSIESLKLENEHQVGELREQLERKSAENAELDTRVREFEETLAKDKDERIQRMLDTQHNLEKEIESLKTALDIKNADLFDLRTKNNELTTKMENFNELNIKMRRYKQEIEQLNAVLKNKQEAERRTSEFNRQLAMKIEMKNRENQRLSMANEQLQFRLQSQPNLSQATSLNGAQAGGNGNSDLSFTSLNMSPCLNNNNYEDQQYQTPSLENEKNYASMVTSTSLLQKKRHDENNDESEMDFIDGGSSLDPSPAVVKLRSKSFKTPVGTSSSSATSSRNNNNNNNRNHNFHMQFRPVSESFDFNINERDMFMTRSAVMYGGDDDSLHMSDLNGGGQANVFDATGNIDVMVGDSIFGMRQRRHNDNDNDDDNSVNSSDHADITQVKSLPTSPNNSNSSEDNKSKDGQDGGKLQAKSAPCMPLKDEQEDQHHQSSLNSSSENNDTINMDQTTSLLDETEHDPKHAASSLNSSHADSDHSDSNSTPKKTTEEETMKEPGQHISSVSSSSVTSSSISAASTTTDGGSKLNATKNDDNNNSLSSSSLSFNDF